MNDYSNVSISNDERIRCQGQNLDGTHPKELSMESVSVENFLSFEMRLDKFSSQSKCK